MPRPSTLNSTQLPSLILAWVNPDTTHIPCRPEQAPTDVPVWSLVATVRVSEWSQLLEKSHGSSKAVSFDFETNPTSESSFGTSCCRLEPVRSRTEHQLAFPVESGGRSTVKLHLIHNNAFVSMTLRESPPPTYPNPILTIATSENNRIHGVMPFVRPCALHPATVCNDSADQVYTA